MSLIESSKVPDEKRLTGEKKEGRGKAWGNGGHEFRIKDHKSK